MQNGHQMASGGIPESLLGRENPGDEIPGIRRCDRIVREDEQFAQNAAFHFLGRLVGERNGEDVAEFFRVAAFKKQPYVCLREIEGFARTRGRFHYPDHRPQIFLKSHQEQVFRSSVLVNGISGLTISSRRAESRSRTMEANFGLSSFSGGGPTKREAGA